MSEGDASAKWDPGTSMEALWDRLAKENAVSAICYRATPEWFEESGQRDGKYLAELIYFFFEDPVSVTVLDIGGGTGRTAKYLAPVVGTYHLLDVSGEMLRQAADRMPMMTKSGKVVLVKGSGHSLEAVADGSIQFAFAHMVFQHMDREVTLRYLRDLPRVLADDGVAWLQLPAMRYPQRFDEADRGDWPANFRRWYPGEFLEVCLRSGLSVIAADCDALEVIVAKCPVVPWLGGGD